MRVSREIERGPQGIGVCKLLKNNIRIEDEDGSIHDISYENVADDVVLSAGKDLSYSLNSNGTWLYSLRPSNGTFFAKFGGMVKRDTEPVPVPKLKPGGPRTSRTGNTYMAPDRVQFTVFHELVAGDFAGTRYVQAFDYSFREMDNGNTELVIRGQRQQRLERFLSIATDGLNFDLPYSDNVLPDLEEILFRMGTIYQIVVEEGWVNGINEIPEGITPDMIVKKKKAK